MRGNTAELRVLAGATLVRHFECGRPWAAAAALAVACAACQGLRPPPVAGILELAHKDLARQSGALRREAEKALPKLDLADELRALKTAAHGNQLPSLSESL